MSLTPAQQARQCPTCGTTGRRGYCAPLRCVCGHEDCPAFASWEPLRDPLENVTPLPAKTKAKPSAWSQRDEPTWLDNL